MSSNTSYSDQVKTHLEEAARVISASVELTPHILAAAELISGAVLAGNKVMWCGNGGSAADSQHLAAELVGRYKMDRAAIASVALTTDTSVLTAIANDFGYDHVFERQIQSLGKRGDVLVALSTSGKSASVLRALNAATKMGISTVLLSSKQAINVTADIAILVNSSKTEHIQHAHIAMGHVICELIELNAFAK